jgi:hypothetical protein
MFIAALENHEASSFMQDPSVSGIQNLLTGVQTKRHAATVAMVYEMMTAMKLQHQIWKRRVAKTRWYWRRMASLVSPMDAQYTLILKYKDWSRRLVIVDI